jgi:hypothetical protein
MTLCNKEESVHHLMFQCPLATFTWSVISDGMNWDSIWKSVKNFNDEFQLEGDKKNGNTCIMCMSFSCT